MVIFHSYVSLPEGIYGTVGTINLGSWNGHQSVGLMEYPSVSPVNDFQMGQNPGT